MRSARAESARGFAALPRRTKASESTHLLRLPSSSPRRSFPDLPSADVGRLIAA